MKRRWLDSAAKILSWLRNQLGFGLLRFWFVVTRTSGVSEQSQQAEIDEENNKVIQ